MQNNRGAIQIPCPVCAVSSARFTTIQSWEIFKCPVCGHGFVHPLPPPDELARAYNTTESTQSNSNAFALLDAYLKDPATVRRHYSRLLKRITSLLPATTENPAILEAGCSTGVLLRCLRDGGLKNISGLEINAAAAAVGADKLGITIHNTSIEQFNSEERYDLIIAYAIIEHVIDPVAALRKLAMMLTSNGVIFFAVPNFNGALRRLLGDKWLWYIPPYHLHHFTPKSMRLALQSAGLVNSRIATENTATNAYLLHYIVFGPEKTESVKPTNPNLYKITAAFDAVTETLLYPILRPLRAAGLGAHIAGSAQAQKPDDRGIVHENGAQS